MSFVEKIGLSEDFDPKNDKCERDDDDNKEDSLCSSDSASTSTSYSYVYGDDAHYDDDDYEDNYDDRLGYFDGYLEENTNILCAETSPGGGRGSPAAALFNCDPITCPICFVEADSGEALTLPDCQHSFCIDCFKKYITTQIHDGKANEIVCPMPTTACKRVDLSILLEDAVLDVQTIEKLKYCQKNAFVLSNPEYHHCPTPDCTNIVYCKDGQLPIVDCFKCNKTSCLNCNASPYHTGMSCDENKKKQKLLEKQLRRWRLPTRSSSAGSNVRVGDLGSGYNMVVDRSRAGEELQHEYKPTEENFLELNIRVCRRCGSGIEHDGESCLKMKCLCGYRFCFMCGAENAQCHCTPPDHGFTDNVTGNGDFAGLNEKESYT